MKGYIKRIQNDLSRLAFKRSRVEDFLNNRAEEFTDARQNELMQKQLKLMQELESVLQSRLDLECFLNPEESDEKIAVEED